MPWSNRNFYVADPAVSCAPMSYEQWCPDPVLIVEILSPSTEGDDRGVKRPSYRRLPSVHHILFLAIDRPSVEHYARHEPFWRLEDLAAGDTIRLEALGLEIPVDELYADLVFQDAGAADEG